jgi:2'-5' RNA ligase
MAGLVLTFFTFPRIIEKIPIIAIEQLASITLPITTIIKSVERFPDTNLFYYSFTDDKPFKELQNAIVSTGMKFKGSPFQFTPHCTIVGLGEQVSEELINTFSTLIVPKETIMLDTLSLYSLNGIECNLLYRTKLRGNAPNKCCSRLG